MTDVKFVLDSSVLSEYKNGGECVKQIMHMIIDGEVKAGISPLSLTTLWSDHEFDRKTEIGFTTILEFVESIELDESIAKGMSLYISNTENDPTSLEIAAVICSAQSLGCPIVSERVGVYSEADVEVLNCQGYMAKF